MSAPLLILAAIGGYWYWSTQKITEVRDPHIDLRPHSAPPVFAPDPPGQAFPDPAFGTMPVLTRTYDY